MTRFIRAAFWTTIAIALFIVGSLRLHHNIGLGMLESLLFAVVGAILIWLIGLKFFIGKKSSLPKKVLRDPRKATPEEFERLCAEIYRSKGYDVELTGRGADYGADAIARKDGITILVGAKRFTNEKVGNRWVQQLLGSMHHFGADYSVLITTSDFTKQAVEQAEAAPIDLIDGQELMKMIKKYLL